MTSRSWVFTINNYTLAELEKLEFGTPCRYMIFGLEEGAQKTPHIQGYIEFDAPKRLSGVAKLLPRAHLEPRRGTRDEARQYCQKDDEWIEVGKWEAGGQGARTDLQGVMQMVKERKKILEIIEEAPITVANNLRFVDRYRELVEKEQTKDFRQVEVHAYVGDAGSGKTRKAHEDDPDIFTVNAGESFPFEGYDGEEAILIDDFYGDIKYHEILRILDGHQYRVNVKGGHRYARWNKVIITSNKVPEQWYQFGMTPALKRRISSVTMFCNEEPGNSVPALLQGPINELTNEVDDNIMEAGLEEFYKICLDIENSEELDI